MLDLFKGKQGDQKLRETVLKISEFLTTQPFPDKWLDDMLENYSETDIEKTVWGKIIIDYALSLESFLSYARTSVKKVDKDL